MDLKTRVLAAAASGAVVLGTAGASLIQTSEGLHQKVYKDPVGILTVCWGHTSPHLRLGQTYTLGECQLLFRSDVAKHQKALYGPTNCIRSAPLTGNQSDALTSFAFNLGVPKFCGSTLAKKVAARDYEGAAKEFPKWKYAKGRVLPGLVTRRSKEQELFRSKALWVSIDLKDLTTMGSVTASDKRK